MKITKLLSTAFIGSTCALSVLGYSLSAKAVGLKPVDIELLLLLDASDSISANDFNNQIDTFSKIFSAGNFYDVFVKPLKTTGIGALAVSAYQFGTQGSVSTPVISQLADWVLIDEQHQQAGNLFSKDLSDGINKLGNLTPIGDAISFAVDALLNNEYNGKMVMNLSTDGFNTGETILSSTASRYAWLKGVTINSIVIPATQSDMGADLLDPRYNLPRIQKIVNPYPGNENTNFDGSPAFIMMDYAKGEKSLADALLLKLGKETIGETLFSSSPPLTPPGSIKNPPGSGGNPPTSGTSGNSSQTIPEPNAILGLLSVATLGLIKKIRHQ